MSNSSTNLRDFRQHHVHYSASSDSDDGDICKKEFTEHLIEEREALDAFRYLKSKGITLSHDADSSKYIEMASMLTKSRY